jgi:hypothetical protein
MQWGGVSCCFGYRISYSGVVMSCSGKKDIMQCEKYYHAVVINYASNGGGQWAVGRDDKNMKDIISCRGSIGTAKRRNVMVS